MFTRFLGDRECIAIRTSSRQLDVVIVDLELRAFDDARNLRRARRATRRPPRALDRRPHATAPRSRWRWRAPCRCVWVACPPRCRLRRRSAGEVIISGVTAPHPITEVNTRMSVIPLGEPRDRVGKLSLRTFESGSTVSLTWVRAALRRGSRRTLLQRPFSQVVCERCAVRNAFSHTVLARRGWRRESARPWLHELHPPASRSEG